MLTCFLPDLLGRCEDDNILYNKNNIIKIFVRYNVSIEILCTSDNESFIYPTKQENTCSTSLVKQSSMCFT